MININKTFGALMTSFISMMLCILMLLSSTYAWFFDSVDRGVNTIQAGNLDIDLEFKTDWNAEWSSVDENTKIFQEGALYEPGYTEIVYLRVSNLGSLALKYTLSFDITNEKKSINVLGQEFYLADFLQIGTHVQNEYFNGVNDADCKIPYMFGNSADALENVALKTVRETPSVICKDVPILPGDDTSLIIVIVLTMPEAHEENNNMKDINTKPGAEAPSFELGVNLNAIQFTYENDSFGNDYDAGATLEKTHDIVNLDTLIKAFKEGGEGRIVNMHIDGLNGEHVKLENGKTLDLNMNTSTLVKDEVGEYAIVNKGDLSITGDGTILSNMYGSIENWGKLYINNLNIDVNGIKYGMHVKAGEAEINNLILKAQRGGLNVQGGKVVVNSGSFNFSGYYDTAAKKWYNGQAVYAVGVGTEVVINGGDFRFTGGVGGSQRVLCAQDGATIIVNGGTFGKGTAKTSTTWLWEYDSNAADGVSAGEIIIYGGTFQFDPSACVADGYKAVKGSDGWWTVSKIAD